MANFYTYGDMPDVEEAVSGISSKDMESILSQYSPEAAPEMAPAVSDVGALEEFLPAEERLSVSDEQELIAAREAQLAREAAMAERAEAEARTAREAAAARREQERIAAEQESLAAARAAEEAKAAEAARVAEAAKAAAPSAVSSPIEAASPFVEPKTPEQAKAMQESYALLTQADAARMEPIGALNFALDFGGGGGGGLPTVIEKSLYAPEETDAEKAMREEIAKSYVAPAKAPEVSTAEVAKMSGLSEEDLTAAQKQISEPYLERNAILSEIGGRLKANDFKGAFDVALKAEQEGKGMFFENIIDPDKMRYLRGPMTADEMRKFYAELPQDEYLKRYGDRSDFISERALERNLAELGGKAGFADPRAGLKAKESVITDAIKFATEYGLDAIMAAAGIPPTFAALTKAAQTYAETGGNMEAVLKAAAATYVGTTVGQKVGDLIPSSSAVSKAAESAVEKAATQGVAAGLTGDALAEVVVRAAAEQGLGSAVTGTLVSKAIDNALRNQAEAGLEQIEVSTFKPSLEKALASTVTTGGVQDILSERQIQEAKEAEQKAEEDLEEIKVTGKKPFDPALTLGTPDISKETKTDLSEETTESKSPLSEEELEEIKITGKKPFDPALTLGTGDLTEGFKDPNVDPVTGEQEVVVKGTKPPPLDIKDVAIGLGTDALTEGFREPNVDPVTGEPKKPSEVKEEIEKMDPTAAPPPSFLDKLKDLLGDYATPENILKLLGGLAAGTSSSGTTTKTTGTGVTGGLGGALPKYEIKRTQLSPDIDYYTYGTRPEARFFEYAQKVVEPTQPPAKEPETGMATGGLTGYAAGGSNRSRYMAGEGSGRDDKIPALLSDGEYVMDAETLALLGDGSTKEGARRMDQFRANIRKHKGRALSRGQISPDAKSPDKYMGGGLT